MAKKPTVTTLQSGFNSTEVLNENFDNIRDAFDNTLSLDGSTPNAMQADLDLNGNNLIGATGLLINGTDYLADVETAKAAALVAQAAAELAENNAETAEVNAEASETAAGLSATAAATSATASAASAVDATNNGAAQVSLAADQVTLAAAQVTLAETAKTGAELAETNAETAESNASTFAANAATSETNASTSASTASTKASEAATSATNAASSASSAASSASSAQASKDAALAALDSFDDRYLGQKASDPTLDNDGDALVAGALYFNTTDDVMKVYEGSVWVAAYASLSGALLQANNLSDVLDVAASRTNLGLATVAATGAYTDLSGKPVLGTAAATASTDYATAAQGTLADSAVQPNDSPTFAGLTVDAPDGEGILLTGGTGSFSEASYLYAQGERGRFGYNGSRVSISDYSSAGSTSNKSLSIELGGAERFFINHTTGDISFYEDTGTTPKFFWDASAESLGIGTTSPVSFSGQTSLTVRGTSVGRVDVQGAAGAGGGALLATSTSMSLSSNYNIPLTLSAGTLSYTAFNTSGTERMRIDSSGNVGIGTSSPSQKLDVSGNARLVGSDPYLQILRTSDFYYGKVSADGFAAFTNTNGSAPVIFKTATTERMRIDSSGNVGVGTTAPTEKLDVSGTVKATAFVGDGSGLTGINAGVGSGQTWQSVSRSAGTSYQNTTGKPIMVAYMNNNIVSYEPQVSTNNSSWVAVGSGDNAGGGQVPQQFIVPDGHYYRINTSSAGVKIWSELR